MQEQLIRRAVEVLRAAGVRVAIVEGPLHPAAVDLRDPELRGEFLAFARSLQDQLGIAFLPLEAIEPYAESDFADLVHVGPEGVPKTDAQPGRGSTRSRPQSAAAPDAALETSSARTPAA